MAEQANIENTNEYNKINKNYQIIYLVIFKYGAILIVFIISIILFISEIQKRIILDYDNIHETEEERYLGKFQEKLDNIGVDEELNINILIKNGFLDTSETLLHSYNNLLTFKGLIMPRGTYIRDNDNIGDTIKDIEYFNNPNYDINELNKFMTNVVYIDFDNIKTKTENKIGTIPLDNNIEDTFFISCANDFKIFNLICNSYIENFLEKFFLYDIEGDITGTVNMFKTLIGKKHYKKKVCNGLINYMKYSNEAPAELEDISMLCGGEYQEYFYLMRDFLQTNHEIDNRYIKPNVSKVKEVNAYKLLSYQQLLYNNIEKSIPPYEGTYKDYTNYIAALLKKENNTSLDKFYFDVTFWFNNFYLIPNLNKIKYQSTQTKREEIESILTSLEKINNGNQIEGYQGLRDLVTNDNLLQKEIENIGLTGNVNSGSNNKISVLLKGIKSLNYLKIINDEISGNQIKINGYLTINSRSIYFGTILENKNGILVVKNFSLNNYKDLNDIINVIIKQKDYSIQEIYQFIQDNISIYLSDDVTITPCDILIDKLNKGIYELLLCNENRVNIMKGGENESKILYQIKMDNYEITSVSITDPEIQEYINNTLSGTKTNSITVSNIIGNMVSYVPETTDAYQRKPLEGSNDTIKTLEDIRAFLGVIVFDIAEENGKIAAEFKLNNIDFIGIYDPTTKKLGPIYIERAHDKNGLNFKNFSLYLTPENQNEINRFTIETIQYLKGVDEELTNIYINE